jgi:hypothetical protein
VTETKTAVPHLRRTAEAKRSNQQQHAAFIVSHAKLQLPPWLLQPKLKAAAPPPEPVDEAAGLRDRLMSPVRLRLAKLCIRAVFETLDEAAP